MIDVSDKNYAIEASKTTALTLTIKQLSSDGHEVFDLAIGESDFPPSNIINDALSVAIGKGFGKYLPISGDEQLRSIIAQTNQQEFAVDLIKNNVLVGSGSKQILFTIFQNFCNVGDEVIVPVPYWTSFPEQIKWSGAKPVFVPTHNFDLDVDKIKQAVTAKTKILIINSPNNPSGAIYSESKIRSLCQLCAQRNILIVSDEAYNSFNHSKKQVYSPLKLWPEMSKQIIVVRSFSKNYAMSGFRLAYCIADEKWIKNLNKMQSQLCGSANGLAQYAGLQVLQKHPDYIKEHADVVQKQRDLAFEKLSLVFDDLLYSQGAFYFFPNVVKYLKQFDLKTSDELCLKILKETGVATVPGSAFGMPNHIRISFSKNISILEKACEKLLEFFK